MKGAARELVQALPDPRREQLVELLGKLPAEKAEKLRDILQSQVGNGPTSPLLADIFDRLALRAGDAGEDQPNALMRRICALFQPFLVSSPPHQPADWLILRSSLMPWWGAAMAASADLRRSEAEFIQAVKTKKPEEIEQAVVDAYDCLTEITPRLTI